MFKSWVASVVLVCAFKGILAQGGCAPGWTQFQGSCYYVHYHNPYDWVESLTICSTHKAHLVYVESAAESDFVKKLVRNVTTWEYDDDEPNVWIGASDEILEGQYVWYGIEQPVTYTDWYPGEPNSVGLGEIEDCVALYEQWNYQWADLPCEEEHYFICEKSANSVEIIG